MIAAKTQPECKLFSTRPNLGLMVLILGPMEAKPSLKNTTVGDALFTKVQQEIWVMVFGKLSADHWLRLQTAYDLW